MLDRQSLTMAQILSRRQKFNSCQVLESAVEHARVRREAKQIAYLSGYCPDSGEVGAKVLTLIGGAPRHGWQGVRLAAHMSANGYKQHHQE
jgi:hypothetical protein